MSGLRQEIFDVFRRRPLVGFGVVSAGLMAGMALGFRIIAPYFFS